MPRKPGEIRKDEILAAARELIFWEGFGNFTVRTVAARVGISEAAIYRHFFSKEELMLGMLDSLFIPWRKAIEELVAEKLALAEKLQKLVVLHLHHLIDKQLNPVLFFSEAIRPENERLLQVMKNNLSFLKECARKIVASAQGSKIMMTDNDVEAATVCVVGVLQASVIRWTLQRNEVALLEDTTAQMLFLARLLENKRKTK